ncbi:MAG: hypothetical protein KJI69_06175 [Patescibacteria group bacterium]|nr:hypothetical protein [Patescibacteria group bacterium]
MIKKLINGFFSRKNRETNVKVDEKNLGEENITDTSSKTETEEKKIVNKEKKTEEKKKTYKYRITSPNNFAPTKHMKHGTSKLCNKIPDWAVNNSKVVIEKLD